MSTVGPAADASSGPTQAEGTLPRFAESATVTDQAIQSLGAGLPTPKMGPSLPSGPMPLGGFLPSRGGVEAAVDHVLGKSWKWLPSPFGD